MNKSQPQFHPKTISKIFQVQILPNVLSFVLQFNSFNHSNQFHFHFFCSNFVLDCFFKHRFKRILKEKVKEKATNGTGNVGVSGSASFSVIVDHFLRIRLTTDPAHKSWRPNLVPHFIFSFKFYLFFCLF